MTNVTSEHPPSPRDEAQIQRPSLGENQFAMADVGEKPTSKRRAIACGSIFMGEDAYKAVLEKTLPKGDVLKAAELVGITGAKQTALLLPLCHPLPLDKVGLGFSFDEAKGEIIVRCEVSVVARTGVEMEALMGVNSALLCLYDLIKPVDPALRLDNIRLELKEGGKKGIWVHPEADKSWHDASKQVACFGESAGIIVLSDRASKGEYEDLAGPTLQTLLEKRGVENIHCEIIPDNAEALKNTLYHYAEKNIGLILTSGGTGPNRRDITSKTVESMADKVLIGIGEALRQQGRQFTKTTWLSNSLGARIKNSLVITLPGNPKSIAESFPVLDDLVPTVLKLIKKERS
ncbi:MAG: bifunctional molybdenum cofactor biosynthesis protein MoaC/MoaB [Endozoicomonadaceae bacterium]|nr:bifunctional molybdenum cofactor biosynthesis protein MoaC/MoaB [Endozoicomonadaceae bacterium]